MGIINTKKQQAAIRKELRAVEKQERSLEKTAMKDKKGALRQKLEELVPDKVYGNLQKAFCTAFKLIFEKGTGIIELGYKKGNIQEDIDVQNYTFEVKAQRKTLKKVRKNASSANLRNLALTAVEGIGLGALGIGLPDIVIFVGVLLKGIYEIALRYGYDYESDSERLFILKLMETPMLRQQDWQRANEQVDLYIEEDLILGDPSQKLPAQIQRTANCFAMDMLVLKFIQGMPIVGILGGMGNPIYYNKVMKYAEIKYRKRYLLDRMMKTAMK